MRHYVIAGAGAIGCYVGSRLAAAGLRVSLVGRPRVIDAVRAQGLRVTDLEGGDKLVPPSSFRAVTGFDKLSMEASAPPVLLLCVKGGATAQTARELAAAFPPGTPLVSLQNGVDNPARIRAAAPQLPAFTGMVPFNVTMPQPNHAHQASAGTVWMQRDPLTAEISPDFEAAGLPPRLEDDMRAVQWGKLLLNLNNPVNALSDLPLREELQMRGYRRVLAALMEEALAALKAAHITPAKVAAAPPHLLPTILRLPDWAFRLAAARMLRIDPTARSSMWDDIQAGRTTEIDDLCGAVLRLAQAHGTGAPVNAAVRKLIDGHAKDKRFDAAALAAACGLA